MVSTIQNDMHLNSKNRMRKHLAKKYGNQFGEFVVATHMHTTPTSEQVVQKNIS